MPVEHATEDADHEGEHQYLEEDEDEDGSACMTDDSRPLLVLFDCKTTRLSIYSDHIMDIGSKVLNPPVPVHAPTFSTLREPFLPLVTKTQHAITIIIRCVLTVSRITGTTANHLRGERPLSVVLPTFLKWLGANTDYVSGKNPDSSLSWYVTIHVVYI